LAQAQVLGDRVGAATAGGAQGPDQDDEEFDRARRMRDPEAIQPLAVAQAASASNLSR